ncbi:hypothetical protein NDU88_001420 [Pleurodeles waltl]|uniref:Uncharacterized protein n=1 Tax=Pleurodeles waltl TaxID=8319 RepID=A0AAV7Q712_PLEWA|nr:hypothetical protein NDU88_001420 [Pleurodeles waltl]
MTGTSGMRKTRNSDVLSTAGGGETNDGKRVAQLVDLVGFGLSAPTVLSDPGRIREGNSHVQKREEKDIKGPRGPGIKVEGNKLTCPICGSWRVLKRGTPPGLEKALRARTTSLQWAPQQPSTRADKPKSQHSKSQNKG